MRAAYAILCFFLNAASRACLPLRKKLPTRMRAVRWVRTRQEQGVGGVEGLGWPRGAHGPVPGRVIVLPLTGELQAASVREVAAQIDELVVSGVTGVVMNLHGVKFIDSSGLACLLQSQARLQQARGELVLSEAPEFIRTVLDSLGLVAVLRSFPDDQAALAYFGESDDDFGSCGARLKPKPPSDSGSTWPDEESAT